MTKLNKIRYSTLYCPLFLLFSLVSQTVNAAENDDSSYGGPYIDAHIHSTYPIAGVGQPPLALCPGMANDLRFIGTESWPEAFLNRLKSPPCDDPIWSPMTDAETEERTIAVMRRLNVKGVVIGNREKIAQWRQQIPDLVIPAHGFASSDDPEVMSELADHFSAGGFEVFAEIAHQYQGIEHNDPRLDANWALAAELDIPVGVHVGPGQPGTPHFNPDYRARLSNPLGLEEILNRHRNLRVYAMHAGWPFRDSMIAMLYTYPGLYVDTGMLHFLLPRAEYYDYLHDLVRAGFVDRIMFGSDLVIWPELIEEGIKAINAAPFLSYEQKKAILHDNAVRFFKLDNN